LTLKLDATSPPDLGGTPQNPEEPISSSHRALNKMAMGILNGTLIGGALVLPTRELYNYLTDRIGNFRELEPYFGVWRAIRCASGLLVVFAVEHDATSHDVPPIQKGTDGWATV
jgi:hypothetical protein